MNKLLATVAVSLAVSLFSEAGSASEPVLYELKYDSSRFAMLDIVITLPPGDKARVFVMPRAIPMGYADVPYDDFVEDVAAYDDDGTPLNVSKDRFGPRWTVEGDASHIRYSVDIDRMESAILGAADSSKARDAYLGALGYSIFGYAQGFEQNKVKLTVKGPGDWPVFLTLSPKQEPDVGVASATADDFYALADSQLIMGPDIRIHKFAAATPVFVAQYAEKASDAMVLGEQAVLAMNALAAYFGEVPFPHYTVHVEFLQPRSSEHDYGFSMEHMDSTTIFFDTSMTLGSGTDSQLTRHLYNLAHHMAHSWIPKRAAARGYFPWMWEMSPVLNSIWFSEGWGQYVAAAALAEEAGLGDDFRHRLVEQRFKQSVDASPDFLNEMSLVDVSRIASTRYSQDFRTGRNAFARGGMMAYEMDNLIRQHSNESKSLRDVVRRLFDDGQHGPLQLDLIPELVREETATDVHDLYQRWLSPLP